MAKYMGRFSKFLMQDSKSVHLMCFSAFPKRGLDHFAEAAESKRPGPSCSKLTMSLVYDSLKFSLSDTQIC